MSQQQQHDPWLNPSVGLELMQNMGLAGSGSQPFAWAASVLLHAALLAPRALYNSPRGRWLMRCLFEAMYQVRHSNGTLQLMSRGCEDFRRRGKPSYRTGKQAEHNRHVIIPDTIVS
jgi:hypothetical protein